MPPRPLRADAQRNRDKLLEVAVSAFSRDGEATLDAIAKEAGVGIGTLYRHFPTRDALVEAAYRNELSKLCDAAPVLLAELPPERALRAWMDRFYGYITTKQGMGDALRALIDAGGNPFATSRDSMVAAVTMLLEAGSKTLRDDVPALDVLTSLSGICLASSDQAQAGRLIDLLLDGLERR
ncbi:TetR/AcrR family transcriptional regulator [Actinomadura barringtoniae]|uniref:TetR/AcrR family transcriptional regulator n=1 Tax=Actinomadura barringtoniae TaxID=1427535 RepID=A0A939PD88_9ACTN|nr:TetR/AcrR family transcriptional regulator [Actinomadura barringtoniae]MBO2450702.1 TetR/AcrR family transcriptional regulator [Actinomadura barringtoniae]